MKSEKGTAGLSLIICTRRHPEKDADVPGLMTGARSSICVLCVCVPFVHSHRILRAGLEARQVFPGWGVESDLLPSAPPLWGWFEQWVVSLGGVVVPCAANELCFQKFIGREDHAAISIGDPLVPGIVEWRDT